MATFKVTIEIGTLDQSRFEKLEALVDTGAPYTVIPGDILEKWRILSHFRHHFCTAYGRALKTNFLNENELYLYKWFYELDDLLDDLKEEMRNEG